MAMGPALVPEHGGGLLQHVAVSTCAVSKHVVWTNIIVYKQQHMHVSRSVTQLPSHMSEGTVDNGSLPVSTERQAQLGQVPKLLCSHLPLVPAFTACCCRTAHQTALVQENSAEHKELVVPQSRGTDAPA